MNINNNNNSYTRKHKRNWNNNGPSPKRPRFTKKVGFKNTPNVRNLNINEASKEARKSIKRNRVTCESPNVENVFKPRSNIKTYRKAVLESLKNK